MIMNNPNYNKPVNAPQLTANQDPIVFEMITPELPVANLQNLGILKAMLNIKKSIVSQGGIKKNRDTKPTANSDDKFKFKFRGIEDIYNCVTPLMADNNVICIPQTLHTRTERLINKKGEISFKSTVTIAFTFYCSDDGSSITAVMSGEANDSGDKSVNKATTIAQKNAYIQTFSIPTHTDSDPEAHHDNQTYVQNQNHQAQNIKTVRNEDRLATLNEKKDADEWFRANINYTLKQVLDHKKIMFENVTIGQLNQWSNDATAKKLKKQQEQGRQAQQ